MASQHRRERMDQYVGLDVSLKSTVRCYGWRALVPRITDPRNMA